MLSMTGFGAANEIFKAKRGSVEISVEVRTVNSKFLDVSIRSPRSYMPFDSHISRVAREFFKRGRVDVNIVSRMVEGASQQVLVNLAQAKEVYTGLLRVKTELGISGDIDLQNLLALPEWFQSKDQAFDSQEEWAFLQKTLKEAMTKALHTRTAEGQALENDIRGHKKKFQEVFEKIASDSDSIVRNLRDRLRERVKELAAPSATDPLRIEQEITLWVARADFREEIDRIRQHLKTFDQILAEPREQGRKLEFLVQELHREVNTLGSKCADAQITVLVIELKTSIERIREQLQNSE
jgi:uncharacterized protein (TIGR00255 family)